MSILNTCTASLRELFLLILLVATASLLLNYHISHYVTITDNASYLAQSELKYDEEGRMTGSKFKIFGRSLNQHAARDEYNVTATTTTRTLLSRLVQIEKRLMRYASKPVVALFNGDDVENDVIRHSSLRKYGIRVVKENDNLTWLDSGTVIQGNWSVLLCTKTSNCPNNIVDISQKVNTIAELSQYTNNQTSLCRLARQVNRSKDKSFSPCYDVRVNADSENITFFTNDSGPVVVATQGDVDRSWNFKLLTSLDFSSNQFSVHGSVVWYLQNNPLTFPAGPLLHMHIMLTSLFPLRLYTYPTMASGPYQALQNQHLLVENTVDEMLQYISETYGLGTSSQWWDTIQVSLMQHLIYIETAIEQMKTGISCRRCFQLLDVDVVCSSIRHCSIIQLTKGRYHSTALLDNALAMSTASSLVAMDIDYALENIKRYQNIAICEDGSKTKDCLSNRDISNILDDRREYLNINDWIKIYPTKGSSKLTPFLSHVGKSMPTLGNHSNTVQMHYILMQLVYYYSYIENDQKDIVDLSVDNQDSDRSLVGLAEDADTDNNNGMKERQSCSNDLDDYKRVENITTDPELTFQRISPTKLNTTVPHDTIVVQIWAFAKSCSCDVRIDNTYSSPGPKNITLGLGENNIRILVIDVTSRDPLTVNTLTIYVHREQRGRTTHNKIPANMGLRTCSLKQDCSLKFDHTDHCGLRDQDIWWNRAQITPLKRCPSGDHTGRWRVPCEHCHDESSCYWHHAKWQPDDCQYEQFSSIALKRCLTERKILFIGDSTNRGIMNFVIEQINGSIWDWDKTHNTKSYTNVNNNNTFFSFAYYPHFWLPLNHRPKFHKVIYQLIKSSLPLENNDNTVLVVGGVQWLAKQHIDLIIEALQRKGLSNITKVVKGLGAGFHQHVDGIRYVPKHEHANLRQREQDVLRYSKEHGFNVAATFNLTMSRYKDFQEGKCACHFHKVTRVETEERNYHRQYKMGGEVNAAYSQIILNQICK